MNNKIDNKTIKTIKAKLTFEIEYPFDPTNYPPGLTIEEMLEYDQERIQEDPDSYIHTYIKYIDKECKVELKLVEDEDSHKHEWEFEGCTGCPKSESGEGPDGCSQGFYKCYCGAEDYGYNSDLPAYKQCNINCTWDGSITE